ncbi:upstream activation factor subunit spp27 [Ziziphus jujuba]|uniref:Upstream activation factor subunit spp27 n=2 Tax=Ziziphus jujuba TaxID=326968 RepID=A0A6P4B8J8_ZIZJJ|nr:upstream activation factor subunit spp27 [Ziziphus jujuba]XP_048332146.1 upstream activation factor subunit spp27-like [Ziziphus jujuba var. spinosa]KAH7525209.1 hypothetical protein FEM48_Zijuj06G0200700 [Ziziphus jujuba var. spinosa]
MSSGSVGVGARVFKGCRALLAPAAKSSSSATTPTASKPKPKPNPAAKPKPKPKPKPQFSSTPKREPIRPTGILKPAHVSPALGAFLGVSETSRADAVKQIWAHIKFHNLQNPADKREINCDEKLKAIFDGKDTVNFLEIGKLLSRHFRKTT